MGEYLPLKTDLKILDLATGTGDQIFALFDTSEQIDSAIGIDLAENMLDIARIKAEKSPYTAKISFQTGDCEHLPFENDSFDAVTFSFGIRNVPNPKQALREIYRVLKPQGKSLILEFSLPSPPLQKAYLFYLRYLLPKIGALLSKHREAYRYLNETIESFPYGLAFLELMQECGFQKGQIVSMALGVVSLYIGEK